MITATICTRNKKIKPLTLKALNKAVKQIKKNSIVIPISNQPPDTTFGDLYKRHLEQLYAASATPSRLFPNKRTR